MKDFNGILDLFLAEIEKNPNKDVDDVIVGVASKLQSSGDKSLQFNIEDLRASLACISELNQNINDLSIAKEAGHSRKAWAKKKINSKLDKIPFLSDERKSKLFLMIQRKVDEMLTANSNTKNTED